MYKEDHHVRENQRLREVREQVLFHGKPAVREEFVPGRWPYTYAADFVRAHEAIIPDIIWDEIEISGGVSRSQAARARTRWANSLGLLDVDVAEQLACGYLIENGVDLSGKYAREHVPTWVLAHVDPRTASDD